MPARSISVEAGAGAGAVAGGGAGAAGEVGAGAGTGSGGEPFEHEAQASSTTRADRVMSRTVARARRAPLDEIDRGAMRRVRQARGPRCDAHATGARRSQLDQTPISMRSGASRRSLTATRNETASRPSTTR